MIGQTLSHFKITAKLGEGGMGEVYRAEDTKLGRAVAIKVLPGALTGDPERLARLEREAKVLASLNHPGIAGIYQVEKAEGVHFLVMELAEGENLAERLARGPLSIEDSLVIALQIAEAIEAAHAKGIVHRDLKPANVMVDDSNKATVLDFGLAKAWEADQEPAENLSMSPTLTAQMTQAGVLLGTVSYMSPEQARGQEVDKQTDIWAFGCVLYEMLTARRAFPGGTTADVLAAIVGNDPDWKALPEATPQALQRLLRRTLAKVPGNRLHDIGDAKIELTEAQAPGSDTTLEGTAQRSARGRLGLALASLALGLALGIVTMRRSGAPSDPMAPVQQLAIRGVVELSDDANLAYGAALIGFDSPMLALSPEGRWLIYVGRNGPGTRLYRHDLTSFDRAQPISGTEGALYAFFSPDGTTVGFLTEDRLKRVSLFGDDLQTLAEARTATRAVWLVDDTIVFGEDEGVRISRVSARGGAKQSGVNLLASMSDVLPDGKRVLASSWDRGLSSDYGDVLLVDLESGRGETLIERGYDARYISTGHLVFARAGSLLAVAFDLESGKVSGQPVTIVPDVGTDSFFSQSQIALAHNGTLAYAQGGDRALGRLSWLDRNGDEGQLEGTPRLFGALDLDAQDGRLAVQVGDVVDSVWIFDLERQEGRRLSQATPGGWPRWSSSGQSLAFFRRNDQPDPGIIMITDVTGTAEPYDLLELQITGSPSAWTPDDGTVAISNWEEGQFAAVDVRPGDPTRTDIEWLRGWGATFSPDGKWMAFTSDETGIWEIYIRSWPAGDVVHQISAGGGIEPRWCPCGALFYRVGDEFWRVEVQTDPELTWRPAKLAFETDFIDTPGISFDVSSDGNRLYVVKQAKLDITNRIHIVANWSQEVGRLVAEGQ